MISFFTPKARIRREAAQWRVRLEGASDEQQRQFRDWHDADPRHADAYARMATIWVRSSELDEAPDTGHQRAAIRTEHGGHRLALAASIALVIALGAVLFLASPIGRPTAAKHEMLAFSTAIGEIRQVELSDGSHLILDSATRVEARYSPQERSLALLEGRVRFSVASGKRPFVVRAGSSQIVATGTLFDVSLIGERTSVLLLEGEVEVRDGANADRIPVQRLAAGHKLVISSSAPAVRQPAPRGEVNWPSRMLQFDNMALAEAAALANRYSRTQLELGSQRVAALRVTGAYRAGDIEALAQGLAAAFGLSVERQANGNLRLVESSSPASR